MVGFYSKNLCYIIFQVFKIVKKNKKKKYPIKTLVWKLGHSGTVHAATQLVAFTKQISFHSKRWSSFPLANGQDTSWMVKRMSFESSLSG